MWNSQGIWDQNRKAAWMVQSQAVDDNSLHKRLILFPWLDYRWMRLSHFRIFAKSTANDGCRYKKENIHAECKSHNVTLAEWSNAQQSCSCPLLWAQIFFLRIAISWCPTTRNGMVLIYYSEWHGIDWKHTVKCVNISIGTYLSLEAVFACFAMSL